MIRLITLFSVLMMYLNTFSSTCDTTHIKPNQSFPIYLFKEDVTQFLKTNNDMYMMKWSVDTFYVHIGENVYYGVRENLSPMFTEFFTNYPITHGFIPFIRDGKSQVMIYYQTTVANIPRKIYIVFEIDEKSVLKNIYIY